MLMAVNRLPQALTLQACLYPHAGYEILELFL